VGASYPYLNNLLGATLTYFYKKMNSHFGLNPLKYPSLPKADSTNDQQATQPFSQIS
jgi:hypothetical protein